MINTYRKQIEGVLPRLFALFDADPLSQTYGIGDRYRWAWKLIDFGNGTFQGAAHGLARLLDNDLLPPEVGQQAVRRRIEAIFTGSRVLMRRNGSFEEALPYESSFCVTALVAYDLLSAVEILKDTIPGAQRDQWLETVAPAIRFLHRSDERHGLISNHLATAAAALFKWTALTGEAGADRGRHFLDRILQFQSVEGWFREYEGADPGYQSLCTYYLADLHRLRPDLGLQNPLQRSLRFLWYFAHPDGSFGGYYGSRNTRFYYPGGIAHLAYEFPEAAALEARMRNSIAQRSTVVLETMDEPNLVPMFNSYCWAAALNEVRIDPPPEEAQLPADSKGEWRRSFAEAGLEVAKGLNHYTIASTHKGGVCYHFPLDGRAGSVNAGLVLQDDLGRHYATQAYRSENRVECRPDGITVTAPLVPVTRPIPTPFQFLVLRLLSLTVMRHPAVSHWIKRSLVKFMITGSARPAGWNRRTIRFDAEIAIEDVWNLEKRPDATLEPVPVDRPFGVIHMASQGYWQRQDDK